MQAAELRSALLRVSLPRCLLTPEETKPRSVLSCQIPLSMSFVAFPHGRAAVPSEFGSPTSPRREPAPAAGAVFP